MPIDQSDLAYFQNKVDTANPGRDREIAEEMLKALQKYKIDEDIAIGNKKYIKQKNTIGVSEHFSDDVSHFYD